MTRKIIIAVIAIILCFTFNVIGYGEENPPVFYIDTDTERYVGEEFTISYGMYNDTPLVDNFELLLYYDPSVLELIGTSDYGSDVGDQTYSFIGNTYPSGDTLEHSDCLYILIKQSYEEWAFAGTYGKRHLGSATFKAIGEGDAGLYYEIKSNQCSNGKKVEVDFNDLENMDVKTDTSEITLLYNEGVLTIEGSGVILGPLEDYDTQNVLPQDYYKDVKTLIVSEGIRILRFRIHAWESLNDIYLPKTLVEFSTGINKSQDITIHSYGMSIGENLASIHDKNFVMVEEFLLGDIDLNGILNAEDALSVLRMAAKISPKYKWSADINADGNVDAADALHILKTAAKLV